MELPTQEGEAVLQRKTQPAWRLISFLAGITFVVYELIEWDTKHARAAAQEVMAPIEYKIDKHIEVTGVGVQEMRNFAAKDAEFKADVANVLYSICLRDRIKASDCIIRH